METHEIARAIAEAYVPSGAGRPSAIADASTLQVFLSELEHGIHMEPAADLAGIAPNTVRAWLKRGEDRGAAFRLFADALKRASARAEASEVKKVRKAGEDPRFWAAAMTQLERRHPDRWARRSEDSGGPKVVVQIGVRDSDVQVSIQGQAPQLAIGEGE
jgi:transposase